MFNSVSNLFGRPAPHKNPPVYPEPRSGSPASAQSAGQQRRQTYSKVFRWRLPDGQTQEPAAVEIVGSFTHWQRVPLLRDGKVDAWHATIHHIEGNKTHHYMLLVDGQPAPDKNCDGYAVPHGPQEEQYQIATPRGPRLYMLFAQAK